MGYDFGMKYLLLIIAILFSSNLYAANDGKGFIELSKGCVTELNRYFNYFNDDQVEEYKNSLIFAAHKDGHCAWDDHVFGDVKSAEKDALKSCNDIGKGCKVFARGSEIVWDWDELPNYDQGGRQQISWKDVEILIGSGAIKFSKETNEAYQDYLNSIDQYDKDVNTRYFSTSRDGKYYGWIGGSISKSDLKKMAIWQCMNKYGDLCYLYAENDKIIWQE